MDCDQDPALLKFNLKKYIGQLPTSRFDKLCRACLSTEETAFLSEVTYESVSLWEVFKNCASVQMEHDDNLPKTICLACITTLMQLHTFKQQCKHSDDILRKVLLEYKSNPPIQAEEVPTYPVIENTETLEKPKIKRRITGDGEETQKSTLKSNKSEFSCKYCSETFTMFNELKTHRRKVHPIATRRITCSECSKPIACSRFRQHMRTHTKEKPFSCAVCGRSFTLKANLQRHTRIHTGERPHICDICGKGYARAVNLLKHKRSHTGEKPFLCSDCGMTYSEFTSYKTHLLKHHTSNNECDICEKSFSLATDLASHKTVHTGEDPFVCSYCGRSFKYSLAYKIHLRKKHEENGDWDNSNFKYECNICKKRFMTKIALNMHAVIHGEKRFLCNVCGKRFVRKIGLKIHMKVHTGEKPYPCTFCNKTFKQPAALITHVRIHTGMKPYVCKICSKAFIQTQHLRYHLRTHSGEKPHVCKFCNKTFMWRNTLTTHVRKHTGETPYICDICDKEFYDSRNLKKHKRRHELLGETPITNELVAVVEKEGN